MDGDSRLYNVSQPTLFDFTETTTGALELFPSVWSALEELTAPEVVLRQSALDRLIELDAHRLSPLVAYLIATRLDDPDIGLRTRVVFILGEMFTPNEDGMPTTESVRHYLMYHLSHMRTRPIYALLEVAEYDPQSISSIARLLNVSPHASKHLSDIMADRKVPIPIRCQAVYYIGQVGYLDAIPALERIASRLESRLNGQQSMTFAPPSFADEANLLPEIQNALSSLRTH
jgi:hypothetical protein